MTAVQQLRLIYAGDEYDVGDLVYGGGGACYTYHMA